MACHMGTMEIDPLTIHCLVDTNILLISLHMKYNINVIILLYLEISRVFKSTKCPSSGTSTFVFIEMLGELPAL